jgi:hypothetical protein
MHLRFAAILFCCVCLGCGPRSPFSYVKSYGKITYEDGTVIPAGLRLQFAAMDAPEVAGAHPRPGIANVNGQGEFDCVTSYKYGDGLVSGKHKVSIEQATDAKGKPLVPPQYCSIATTPLVVDTKTLPFDIKVPKPK